ncbi:hypothetical protein GJ699_02610 [Duganella sp. FT80W]|uniref:Uncharacterized protein n=1 Tax=Duganella guangzhouensis TaxID=2666084 RepID=A0A6I2KU37_9BURK|nr:hypothetical protein [Duganella guangzhouensis]MRW88870.1 hypothetical protein [Duganella guangzhouensis]
MQEWLADRVGFVQYPRLRPADARTRRHHGMQWKYQMPLLTRLGLAVFSLATIVVAGAALIVMLYIAYVAIF